MPLINNQVFAGDKKASLSLLGTWEKKLVEHFVDKIPLSIETQHLTLSTIIWSLFIVIFSYLAQSNILWMIGTSLMIMAQYVTDLFDGAVGRYRKTGLVLWGYYMDHFLDYIFLCSILIGYSFLFNDRFNSLFFILVIFGAYIVNTYLAFATTNEFKFEYLKIGPTEVRFIFILVNILLMIFHKTYLVGFLPYVLIFAVFGLCYVVYATQRKIWDIDMKNKIDSTKN